MEDEVIWYGEERCYAFLVSRHAFFSIIRYTKDGYEYVVAVENDDYDLWEERAIEFETDD
jgi:hypothetical protein